ncbi:hypothetical protein L596_016281 [Steinernema carpocapsae]|uniref:Uncharacterized protein n=1 Tax=Steinernema carpocapsae TaxID=34508 RepID=A0A4U5NI56_STECR|nr:hypothetical protein L596_016281 [Steinernema carpocapsae]
MKTSVCCKFILNNNEDSSARPQKRFFFKFGKKGGARPNWVSGGAPRVQTKKFSDLRSEAAHVCRPCVTRVA